MTAFFDVATDEGFIIKGFKLVNGINGFFVGFPSEKRKDENDEDKYYDTVWLTDEVRENITFMKFIYKQEIDLEQQVKNLGKRNFIAQA